MMQLPGDTIGAGRACVQRGFSLFEMVVVVLLIGVLISLAMDRLMRLQIDAERVSVQYVIGALESAINMHVAELVVTRGLGAIRMLENRNPMAYLSKTPTNYTGAGHDDPMDWQRKSGWCFDADEKILVYTVKNTGYFHSSVEGRPRIRLRLALVYQQGSDEQQGSIRGIHLQSLDEYRWLPE